MKTRQNKIGHVSKTLHWIIALLIISLLALGWYMVGLDFYSPYYYSAPALHFSLGISAFLFVLYKIIWQLLKPLPDYDTQFERIEIILAKFVHIILFSAMILMPVSGYLITTSGSTDFTFFGLFTVPIIYQASDQLRDIATFYHTYFSYILVGFISLHMAAAIKHKFIDKISLNRDMWFK